MSILRFEKHYPKTRVSVAQRKHERKMLKNLDVCFSYSDKKYRQNLKYEFERFNEILQKKAEKTISKRDMYWDNPLIRELFASKTSFCRWYAYHSKKFSCDNDVFVFRTEQLKQGCKIYVR